MKKNGEVCVVCAENKNGAGDCVYQLLTKANELHKCGGGEVIALCVGARDEEFEKLFRYGADKVITCSEQVNNRYDFASIISQMLTDRDVELVMVPASDWGESCASTIAIELKAGLTANCMDVSIESGDYIFTRAAINGSIFAKIAANDASISICTVQRNAFKKEQRGDEKTNNIIHFERNENSREGHDIFVLQKGLIENNSKIDNLEYSRIIFGFGRGLKSENIDLLKRVAKKYHAEIVGTRAVYEQGDITKNRQVGQSGISIAPMIYVAFGISGASQHMVGVMNASQIISINTDSEAPINEFANEVIIADCSDVLLKMDEMTK